MEPANEAKFVVSRKEKFFPKVLFVAEAVSADASLIGRLDMIQKVFTEAAEEDVCANTKCPLLQQEVQNEMMGVSK